MTAGGNVINAAKREAHKEAKKEAKKEARKAAKEAIAHAAARQTHSSQAASFTTKALMKPRQETRVNWYLLTLLNPNDWQEVMNHIHGIPDLFSHLSHVFCTRTFLDIDTSRFDSNGRCNIIVNPQLQNHIFLSRPDSSQKAYALGYWHVAGNTNLMLAEEYQRGNFARRSPIPSESIMKGAFFPSTFSAGEVARSSLPQGALCYEGTVGTECAMIDRVESEDNIFTHGNYEIPITAAVNNSLTFKVEFAVPPSAGGELTIGVLSGNAVRSTTLAVAGVKSANMQIVMDAADTKISGYQFTNSGSVGLSLSSVRLTGALSGPNSSVQPEFIPAENSSRHLKDFSAVRCVAGSAWLKYRGDTTKNGNLAGALVDSLVAPSQNSMLGYEQIADYMHSYEGSIQTGMYGIWCPMNYADINFTPGGNPDSPYLSYGLDVTDVEAQSFRLECFFVWEGLTQDNVYNPSPGTVDIAMVDHAFHHLAGFNKVMCNSFHLSKIADFLKKGGSNLSKFMSGNAGKALTGALTAISPLVGIPPGAIAGLNIARTALSSQ